MRLYQYWGTGAPPPRVAAGIRTFQEQNTAMKHRLYARKAAAWFIRKRVGEREWRAFNACAVPAMQADYFRLCALWATGGVYADADQACGEPLHPLLSSLAGPLVPTRKGLVTQHFLIFPRRGDAFLRVWLDLASLNIEARDIPSVHTATGPGAMRALWSLLDPATAEANEQEMTEPKKIGWGYHEVLERAQTACALGADVRQAFAAISTVDREEAFRWFAPIQAGYKMSAVDWRRWPGSIYMEEAPEPAGA